MQESGAITSYIDVAQITLYVFWAFFAGLIFYLRREDRREGYPLVSDEPSRSSRSRGLDIFPWIPAAKTFFRPHGDPVMAPREEPVLTEFKNAERTARWPGAPLQPTGNPLLAGVGPGAYAEREDVPEMTLDGKPIIVPMRTAKHFSVEEHDADPRGMDVIGGDGKVAGKISDLWVDEIEPQVRYLEIEVQTGPAPAAAEGEEPKAPPTRRVLVPMGFAKILGSRRQVHVTSIEAAQFADVPRTRRQGVVTKLEEERISAYYAAGTLYANPSRQDPIL